MAGSCLASGAAWAQTEPAPEAGPTEGVAQPAAEQDTDRDYVVVTARHRDEDAQDVPIALSVVGEEALEQSGSSTLGQIQQLVPSLQVFSFNPRNTNILIRGLGSNVSLTNDGFENGVGFYVDNVYYGRPGQTQFDLVDLQQVEVLRGPQGTLFGKNTSAGAINVSTRKPSFNPDYFAEATLGNYDYRQVKLSATGPLIGDWAAYRLTGAFTDRAGFVENVLTGDDAQSYENVSVRGQLLLLPSDDLEIRLIGDYSKQDARCCVNQGVGFFGTYDNGAVIANNYVDRATRAGYTRLPFDPFARKIDANSHYQANMKAYGVSGEVNWDLDFGTLTSISAYRWWDWNPSNDGDGSALPIITVLQQENRQRQFSQEVRFASDTGGAIDYVVGAYYYWQLVSGSGATEYGPAFANWTYPAQPAIVSSTATDGFRAETRSAPRTESYAAFGQANWTITDQLRLTAGVRFTSEEKEGYFLQQHVGGLSLAGLTPAQQTAALAIRNQLNPAVYVTGERKDDDVTGLLSLSYAITPDSLAYASISKGGKSGGLNLTNLPAGISPSVEPESVESVELGLKNSFFDGALIANFAIYETEISDYQTTIVEQVPNTVNLRQYIANIPLVRSRGAEADVAWRPLDNLSFTGSIAYTEAKYAEYENGPQAPENLNLGGRQDLSGKPLAGVPRLSYSLSGDYFVPIEAFGPQSDLYLRADYSDRTSYYTTASNSRYSRVPGYALLNLRVGIRSRDRAWDASIWARNALDEEYFQTLGVAATGLISGNIGEPRTYGVTVRSKF